MTPVDALSTVCDIDMPIDRKVLYKEKMMTERQSRQSTANSWEQKTGTNV